MVRACLWFVAGVFAPQLSSFSVSSDPISLRKVLLDHPALAGLIVAILLLAGSGLPARVRQRFAWFCLGAAVFCLQAVIVIASRLDPLYEGDSLLTQVRVLDFPRTSGQTTSFIAAPISDPRVPEKIRISWFEPPVALKLGDIWTLELRLRRPRGSSNPGGMDFESWLFRDRTGATGHVVSGLHNRLVDSATASGIDALRLRLAAHIASLDADPGTLAVLSAIVVGARHGISAEQWERYAATGTSHLMAISGLHVGLAASGAGLLALLMQGVLRSQHARRVPAVITGVVAAAAYASVSGLAVPAQRATLMILAAAVLVLLNREVRVVPVLASVAALIVLADPLVTMAPGFKLSFAAVALLAWLARRQSRGGPQAHFSPVQAAKNLLLVQVWLLAGLTPLTVLIFDRVSLLAPFVNLLAVPLFSLLTVPVALFGLLLSGPFRPAGDGLLEFSAMTIGWLEKLILLAVNVDEASRVIPGREGLAVLCLWLPVAWILLPASWPGRWCAWLGLASLLWYRPVAPPVGCLNLTFLDVGQGMAVVGQTHRRTLLYDAGPAWRSGGDAGERVILPFLRNRGIRQIDSAIISHSDLDHAGGLPSILDAMTVAGISSGDPLPWPHIPDTRCRAGQSWRWDGVDFRVLFPPEGSEAESNSASCVLLIEAGRQRILLPGDIESAEETFLVQQRVLPAVDVAAIPHHGSRTSSIRPFVRALSPEFAVVSASYANQWGFPKDDIVARWRVTGATVLNTATSGAVRFRMCSGESEFALVEQRLENRRFWHAEM